ncbi:GFA family protein [Caldimonas sp. KR1-144]|uniref:GFA family protein n=1 Tax=Caldimonas sp. KR1-144 TaxID=3400911 RepID=UPI003C0EDEB2
MGVLLIRYLFANWPQARRPDALPGGRPTGLVGNLPSAGSSRRCGTHRFTGACLCGGVQVVASGRRFRVGLCHCLDCRKHHGALFHASAVFPQDAVTIDGEARDDAGGHFCPRRGSPVFARTTADEIEVSLGSLWTPLIN